MHVTAVVDTKTSGYLQIKHKNSQDLVHMIETETIIQINKLLEVKSLFFKEWIH